MLGRKALTLLAAGLLLMTASCTGNSLDDGDSANVVLQVAQIEMVPITCTVVGGLDTFTITEATATLNNVPKTEDAITSPFNDILVESLTISYDWDDGFAMAPFTTTVRVVVPANGANTVEYLPMTLQTLLNSARDGHSAEVTIEFRGHAEDGEAVFARGGGPLVVERCVGAPAP